jgi:hypothetical protein
MMAGGKKTSFGGKLLENVISCLRLKEFQVVKKESPLLPRQLIKNWPYTNIYGTPGRYEWMMIANKYRAIIECKFQNGSGSVDEKFPYVAANFVKSDCHNMIVVHGGEWWITGRGAAAIRWLKKEAKTIRHQNNKNLSVYSFDEFIDFVSARF